MAVGLTDRYRIDIPPRPVMVGVFFASESEEEGVVIHIRGRRKRE
jgi:hypothetical protein